ncbi:MAG: hypothetical protein SNH73_03005 [Rikenellaceae bacterium]
MISRIIRILVTLAAIAIAVIVVIECKSYTSLLPQREDLIEDVIEVEEVEAPQLIEQDTTQLYN